MWRKKTRSSRHSRVTSEELREEDGGWTAAIETTEHDRLKLPDLSNESSSWISIDPEDFPGKKGGQTAAANEHERLSWLSFLRSLQPGDHIAAMRRKGMYKYMHHGIFEGTHRGYYSVIHFQGPDSSYVKGAALLFCNSKCGYQHPKKGGRVSSCLDCFSQGEKMLKFQYMTDRGFVSDRNPNWTHLKDGKIIRRYCTKKYYLEHFMGGKLYGHSLVPKEKLHHYTLDDQVRFYAMISERSSNEVLEKALQSKLEPYSLLSNNCEHFAVYCKTGFRRSIQIQNLPIYRTEGIDTQMQNLAV